jgi:hypothetical protein
MDQYQKLLNAVNTEIVQRKVENKPLNIESDKTKKT